MEVTKGNLWPIKYVKMQLEQNTIPGVHWNGFYNVFALTILLACHFMILWGIRDSITRDIIDYTEMHVASL